MYTDFGYIILLDYSCLFIYIQKEGKRTMEKQEFMTVSEVAETLKVGKRTVYNMISKGLLDKISVKGIRRTLIKRQQVRNLLKK